MARPNFIVRQPRPDELTEIEKLCLTAGWPSPNGLLELYFDLQPSSYFTAVTSDGTILGFCIGFRHGVTRGRIGHLVTRKEYRKIGIARCVLNSVLKYLHGRQISLDAELGMESFYAKFGFTNHNFDCYRICGKADHVTLDNLNIPETDVTVRALEDVDVAALVRFDAKVNLIAREDYLRGWLHPSRAVTLCAVNKRGEVVGYIGKWVMEKGVHRTGPFYANEDWIARMLWKAMVGQIPKEDEVYVKVPSICPRAVELISSTLLGPHRENHYDVTEKRLYNIEETDIPFDMVYGVTDNTCAII